MRCFGSLLEGRALSRPATTERGPPETGMQAHAPPVAGIQFPQHSTIPVFLFCYTRVSLNDGVS
jgi:hypothetical protein